MAYAANIDTLKISKRFEKAGIDKKAAEEIAEVINEVQSKSIEELATKQDIVLLEAKLESVKKDIIIKLGSLMTIGLGVIAILIKF